jgi:hypothetical protein
MEKEELKEHTECGTSNCCGGCETASNDIEVPFNINIRKDNQLNNKGILDDKF